MNVQALPVERWPALTIPRRWAPYLFLTPFYVLFLAFWAGPIVLSLYLAFLQWDGMTAARFVGLGNFAGLIRDSLFWAALNNTLVFVFWYELLLIGLGLVLAVGLNAVDRPSRAVYGTIYFLPVAMAFAVVALVFNLIYSRQFGLLNQVLRVFGIPSTVGWLDDERFALGSIVALRVWRALGYYAMILLTGLQAVPREVIEAAVVDGATSWRRFFQITLPLMRPVLVFAIIMSAMVAFQVFDEPWVLNGGGPGHATTTLMIYLYQSAFGSFKLGYGAAISYTMTLLMTAFSLAWVRVIRREF
jgi:ABC-type sugar transport system permease subunit